MKKSALIIANWQYEDPLLRGLVSPSRDAEALAQVLSDAAIGGFEVQTLTNAPSHKVCEETEAFFGDRERDDLLLFYFSGHGVTDDDGQLYYAAANTLHKRLRSTSIAASWVNDVMNECRSRRQVMLLDCCHSGAFARTKSVGHVNVGKYFTGADATEGRGKFILTACDAFQYSFEGESVQGAATNSVFTEALIQGLRTGEADLDGDGAITLDELYDFVFRRVRERTPQQTPRKWASDVEGAVIIATNPTPTEAPLPEDLQSAIDSFVAEVRERAIPRLDKLMRGKHRGLALSADKVLRALATDDSRRVSTAAQRSIAAFEGDRATGIVRTDRFEIGAVLTAEQIAGPAEKTGGQPIAPPPDASISGELQRTARLAAEAERAAAEKAASDKAAAERAATDQAKSGHVAAEQEEAQRILRQIAEDASQKKAERESTASQFARRIAESAPAPSQIFTPPALGPAPPVAPPENIGPSGEIPISAPASRDRSMSHRLVDLPLTETAPSLPLVPPVIRDASPSAGFGVSSQTPRMGIPQPRWTSEEDRAARLREFGKSLAGATSPSFSSEGAARTAASDPNRRKKRNLLIGAGAGLGTVILILLFWFASSARSRKPVPSPVSGNNTPAATALPATLDQGAPPSAQPAPDPTPPDAQQVTPAVQQAPPVAQQVTPGTPEPDASAASSKTEPTSASSTKMQIAVARSPATIARRIRIEPAAAASMILSKTTPKYPPIARAAGIGGVVALDTVVARDGTVESLRVLSGPPLLCEAAIEALKNWRFRPYFLNGHPTEWETTIDIHFSITK